MYINKNGNQKRFEKDQRRNIMKKYKIAVAGTGYVGLSIIKGIKVRLLL